MKVAHVTAIARKQFLTLKHDRRSLALMLFAPVMAMLIFGFAFGNSPKHIPVIIVNQDKGGSATKLVDKIDHDTLQLTSSSDADWARQQVRDGKAVGAVIFGPDFTAESSPSVSVRLVAGKPVAVPQPPKGAHAQVYLDTTNQQLSAVVIPSLASATLKLAQDQGAKSPIAFDLSYAFSKAKDARYIDYFVPGIMAFAVMLFTTLLTLLAFVSERTSGTLNRLRVSPATEAEVVLGYELAFGLIAAVQGFLVLAVAIWVYHILVLGPLWVAALLVVLTAVTAQAIGILVSAAAQREGQAIQFIPFIIFPVFLLSGIFVPVASLPGWLRPFCYLIPPTWSIDALRDVMLRGWGVDRVWLNVTILAVFTVVFTLLAIAGLKRRNA
ncbi:MAG TPA: ABC transporter permease [Candidatus Saccharimonadia bacterium]